MSHALGTEAAESTRLALITRKDRDAHPGKSLIHPLPSGVQAFAARVEVIRAAERTVDLQYYIWRDDLAGRMLLAELLLAADRGVRIRLLVDDNGIAGMDALLAAVDTHPNIEVRIFNPFPTRRAKWLGFITDFSRVNRRMHNKSLTADGIATIVGGRNIGNEYFDIGDGTTFADLDILAVGPVAADTDHQFDAYWNSVSAWPASTLLPTPTDASIEALRQSSIERTDTEQARAYRRTIAQTSIEAALAARHQEHEWATTKLVADDPAKVIGKADRDSLLLSRFRELFGSPQQSLELVSPYFVPGRLGSEHMINLVKGGARVRVLTNSLVSNDVVVVHAGYAKWRRQLLEGGVELYEMRPERESPGSEEPEQAPRGFPGSSNASLHAKTFAVDGRQAFVGSFNFDPRSAALNTELGAIIYSENLAGQLTQQLDRDLPRHAWRVVLTPEGRLQWHGQDAEGRPDIRDVEPDTTITERILTRVFGWLPIEPLL